MHATTGTPGGGRVAAAATALALVLGLVLAASPASARSQASLGDLQVSASRVPDGHAADWFEALDTSGWTVVDVPAQSCADDASIDDGAAIQNAVNSAPARSIVHLVGSGGSGPCTYNIGSRIRIERSEIIVRGRGRDVTTLKNHSGYHIFLVGNNARRPLNQPSTSWTGGYAKGTRTIQVANTSGVGPGSWVYLIASYPAAANQTTGAFGFGAQVESLSGNSLTLDRALPISFATGSQRVHRWDLRAHNVGIEDMRLIDADPDVQFQDNLLLFEGATHTWIQGVTFDEGDNRFMEIIWSARTLVRGNVFQGLHYPYVSANNHRALTVGWGSTDTVIENNAFLDAVPRGVTIERTAVRTYVAYNYFADPGDNLCADNRPGGGGRSVFHHGFYSHSSIVEGNDARCKIEADNYWGNQGPYITYYRNRVRTGNDPNWEGMLGTEEFGNGELSYVNYLGNHVARVRRSGGGAVDMNDTAVHGERNVIRVSCSLQQLSGAIDPQCANNSGAGTNATTTWQDNVVGADAAPASWDAFDAPDSLIYDAAPSWWCQESCSFAAHEGIGAFGDDFSGSLCSLPAERWSKGLACTPLAGGGESPPPAAPQPPMAPVLLP